jgi:hypothetical protein
MFSPASIKTIPLVGQNGRSRDQELLSSYRRRVVRSSVISTSEELHEGGELLKTKSLDSLPDGLRVRTTLNPAPTGLWPISRIFRGEHLEMSPLCSYTC